MQRSKNAASRDRGSDPLDAHDMSDFADECNYFDNVRDELAERDTCDKTRDSRDGPLWARSDIRKLAVYPAADVYLGQYHVYEGCRLTIEGATGDGKSMLGIGMALAIARKEPFLHLAAGNVTDPVNVLYLDYEMGRVELQRRMTTFGTHPNLWIACFDDPELGGGLLPIDTDAGEKQLINLVNIIKARVVFLDNLYSAVEGSIIGGSGDGQAHERVVPLLRRLSRYNVATVLLAHTNTNGDLYGDKRLTWQLTGRLRLTRIRPTSSGPDSGLLRATIEERKVRGGAMTPPYNAVLRDSSWTLEDKTKPKTRNTRHDSRVQLALACIADLAPRSKMELSHELRDSVPRGREVYGREDLRELFVDRLPADTSDSLKRKAFQRVISTLVDRRLIGMGEEYLWLLVD